MEKTVLIVEDSASNRKLLCELVERVCSCTVIPAADGEEAVALAREKLPDLILMDLKLPGIDGVEATRRIKLDPATASIPTLALTGYITGSDEERVRAQGFDGFLPKPFNVPKLLETVSGYIPPRKRS